MNYEILIKNNCFYDQLKEIKPKLIICDSNVLVEYSKVEYIETSEAGKNFDLYFQCIAIFEKYNINRNDFVMFVGGGVLIDVASFAAATYKRGIKYINVPTTTLSMIDSSVGSKNGLNYNGQKNLIGTFNDPFKVIIDTCFLKTLDQRNFNNGMAEAIKIGYLSNEQIICELEEDNVNVEKVIELSVLEKLKYVKRDREDHGYRNYLNFGHTFGHAIESLDNFQSILHGEAVSIGMVIASGYNFRLIQLLNKFDLPTKLPASIKIKEMVALMQGDKKNTSNLIRIILKNPELKNVELEPEQVISLIDKSVIINNKHFKQSVTVNKSKSHLHRILAAILATRGKTTIDFDAVNDLSDDVIQSINVLKAVGCKIEINENQMYVDASTLKKPEEAIFIYKSATTYRIFAPLLCGLFDQVEITLDEQLASRPHTVFTKYITNDIHQIPFEQSMYEIDGSLSSQFISGYIFALIAKSIKSEIHIQGEITSRPYIEMTLEIAREFGVTIDFCNNVIKIIGFEQRKIGRISPEPDYSSLGYFTAYNYLCEINGITSQLQVKDKYTSSKQADSILPQIINNLEIDMSDCPDLLPTLVIVGLLNKRGIKLTNTKRIKYKECDRIEAMINNLADLDAIEKTDNSLIVNPVSKISGRNINTYGDHRIAMAFTILAPFCTGEIVIDDRNVIDKSFPMFFKQLIKE